MFFTKLDQSLYELRLTAWLLRNFQAAKRRELYIDIAQFASTPADAVQHFQQFLLVPVSNREDLFEQRLQTAS